jgi:hypothetical protein
MIWIIILGVTGQPIGSIPTQAKTIEDCKLLIAAEQARDGVSRVCEFRVEHSLMRVEASPS